MDKTKEQILYDKFIDRLIDLLDNPELSDKELRVISNFLDSQNIGANPETNEGLKTLTQKYNIDELPFDVDELPAINIKK